MLFQVFLISSLVILNLFSLTRERTWNGDEIFMYSFRDHF